MNEETMEKKARNEAIEFVEWLENRYSRYTSRGYYETMYDKFLSERIKKKETEHQNPRP
uniref:Uncharacterized protein n=1 Tax=viral metagenome TaxID=1070528 RepID=A0A6M3J6K1_9ZZZZ